jgi:hypothetical protein
MMPVRFYFGSVDAKIKTNVTAQPCWVEAFESLPQGANREGGARFENAKRFQISQ